MSCLRCLKCGPCADCDPAPPPCFKTVMVLAVNGRTAITAEGPVRLTHGHHARPGQQITVTCESLISLGATVQHRAAPQPPRNGTPIIPLLPSFDSPQWLTGSDELGTFLPGAPGRPQGVTTPMVLDAGVGYYPTNNGGLALLNHQAGYGLSKKGAWRSLTQSSPPPPRPDGEVEFKPLPSFAGMQTADEAKDRRLDFVYRDRNIFDGAPTLDPAYVRSVNIKLPFSLDSTAFSAGFSAFPPDVRTFKNPTSAREAGFTQRYRDRGVAVPPTYTEGEDVTLRLRAVTPDPASDQTYEYQRVRQYWDGHTDQQAAGQQTLTQLSSAFSGQLTAEVANLGERALSEFRLREVWWWEDQWRGWARQLVLEGRYLSESEVVIPQWPDARIKVGGQAGQPSFYQGAFTDVPPKAGNERLAWVTISTGQTSLHRAPAGQPVVLTGQLATYAGSESGLGGVVAKVDALQNSSGLLPETKAQLRQELAALISQQDTALNTWLQDMNQFSTNAAYLGSTEYATWEEFVNGYNAQNDAGRAYLVSRVVWPSFAYERSQPVTGLRFTWVPPQAERELIEPGYTGLRWRSQDGKVSVTGPFGRDHADLTGSVLSAFGESLEGGTWTGLRDVPYLVGKQWRFDGVIVLHENGGDITAIRSSGIQTITREVFEQEVLRIPAGTFRRFADGGLGSHSWPPQRADVNVEDINAEDQDLRYGTRSLIAFDAWRDCVRGPAPPNQPAHWYWPARPRKRPALTAPTAPAAPLGLSLADTQATGPVLVAKGKRPLLTPTTKLLAKPALYQPEGQLELLDDAGGQVGTTLLLTFRAG